MRQKVLLLMVAVLLLALPASAQQYVYVGNTACLNGWETIDQENVFPTAWLWSMEARPAGSTSELSDPNIVDPCFRADLPGDYVISLQVLHFGSWIPGGFASVLAGDNQPPVVLLATVADSGPAPFTVVFDGSGSYDPEGQPLTYLWDFGDGVWATEAAPSHQYIVPGEYLVRLQVTDDFGQQARASQVISATALGLPVYRLTILDEPEFNGSQAKDINDNGEVLINVGMSGPSSNGKSPMIWSREQGYRPVLADSFEYDFISGSAISNTGEVVGQLGATPTYASRAFYFHEDTGISYPIEYEPGQNAADINNYGQMIGITRSFNYPRAYIWSGIAGIQYILPLEGGVANYVYSLNDAGQVIGQTQLPDFTGKSFIWTAEEGTRAIGGLGGTLTAVADINNHGMVLGHGTTEAEELHTFLWSEAAGFTDLGSFFSQYTSYAAALNDHNEIVGRHETVDNNRYRAFFWSAETGIFYLNDLGYGGFAFAINNHGDVVGYVRDAKGGMQAALWSRETTGPNLPPSVSPTATPTSGRPPLEVRFEANAADPEDDLLTYLWSFGDGATSTLPNPQHTYTAAGTYAAQVTVSDGINEVSASATIVVDPAIALWVKGATIHLQNQRLGFGKIHLLAEMFVPPPQASDRLALRIDGLLLFEAPFSAFRGDDKEADMFVFKDSKVLVKFDRLASTLQVFCHKVLLHGLDASNGVTVELSWGDATEVETIMMKEAPGRRLLYSNP